MGQKVNPNGLRIGINRDWSSHWYADKKNFASCLDEDIKIRGYLEPLLNKIDAGLSRIDIERIKDHITVTVLVSHPAIVIGKDSEQINAIKAKLSKILKKDGKKIDVAIVEIKNPDLDAMLVAKDIAKQLQERASYRVVQKKALQRVMRAGAKGCKTMTKGRIGGAEIARYEEYREGVLSSIRSVSLSIMLTLLATPPMVSSVSRSGLLSPTTMRNSETVVLTKAESSAIAVISTAVLTTATELPVLL